MAASPTMIDGSMHPREIAAFLVDNASRIARALLIIDLKPDHSERGGITTEVRYCNTTNADVAWFIVALQASVTERLMKRGD